LPSIFDGFRDGDDQPFGWAWLIQGADEHAALPVVSLQWSADEQSPSTPGRATPGGLDVLRFFLSGPDTPALVRHADGRRWHWSRHA